MCITHTQTHSFNFMDYLFLQCNITRSKIDNITVLDVQIQLIFVIYRNTRYFQEAGKTLKRQGKGPCALTGVNKI